jgi:hypothetical protein
VCEGIRCHHALSSGGAGCFARGEGREGSGERSGKGGRGREGGGEGSGETWGQLRDSSISTPRSIQLCAGPRRHSGSDLRGPQRRLAAPGGPSATHVRVSQPAAAASSMAALGRIRLLARQRGADIILSKYSFSGRTGGDAPPDCGSAGRHVRALASCAGPTLA